MPSSAPNRKPAADTPPTLSRRMIGWTNNLLATGLILAVGLSFGIQTLRLWQNAGSPQTRPAAEQAASLDTNPLRLDLGMQAGNWSRVEFVGSRGDVLRELVRVTRQELDSQSIQFTAAQSPRLQELADQLRHQQPRWQDDSGHRIYVQDGPLPMALAGKSTTAQPAEHSQDASADLLIGCWTIALPAAVLEEPTGAEAAGGKSEPVQSRAWTLVVCQPDRPAASLNPSSWGLPETVQLRFTMTDEQNQTIASFQTPLSLTEIQQAIQSDWQRREYTAIQWSIDSQRAWGSCRSTRWGNLRVDLVESPAGTEGLMTQRP